MEAGTTLYSTQKQEDGYLLKRVFDIVVLTILRLIIIGVGSCTLAFCAGLGGATAVYLVRLYTDTLVHEPPDIQTLGTFIVLSLEKIGEALAIGAQNVTTITG